MEEEILLDFKEEKSNHESMNQYNDFEDNMSKKSKHKVTEKSKSKKENNESLNEDDYKFSSYNDGLEENI